MPTSSFNGSNAGSILKNPTAASIASSKSSNMTLDIGRLINTSLVSNSRDTHYEFLFSGNQGIIDYFRKFPSRWDDILQKARKYGAQGSNKSIGARADIQDNIAGLLIVPDTEENQLFIGNIPTIISTITKEIDSIAEYAAGKEGTGGKVSRSFIETSGDKLGQLNHDQISYIMGKLIERNIDSGKPLIVFNKIFRDIIYYCKSIFYIDIEKYIPEFIGIQGFTDFNTPARHIYRSIKRGGMHREAGVLFLKALYAWGGLDEIKRTQRDAKRGQDDLFEYLNKRCDWMHGDINSKKSRKESKTEITEQEFQITINGKSHTVILESRVKTIESTLIKLFADENYNNRDSVKDTLGVRLFFTDRISKEDRLVAIGKLNVLLGTNCYIFKEKTFFEDENDKNTIEKEWAKNDNQPVHKSSKKKQRTGARFSNVSYSGYSSRKIGKTKSIGTEVQIFKKRGDEGGLGEEHHTILDARKIVQAWVRNSGMITLPQIIEVFRDKMEIDSKNGKGTSGMSLSDGVISTIKKMCKIYTLPDNSVIFSVVGFEDITHERYSKIKPYVGDFNSIEILLNTSLKVSNILSINASPSTPETASQPQPQDR